MATSIDQFWQLAVTSGLLSTAQVEQLAATYRAAHGDAPPPNSAALARWLVGTRLLSAYQAQVLEAGHAGPFFYGDYLVYHRYTAGVLAGMFRAVHVPTQHVVVLRFLTGAHTQNAKALGRLAQRMAASRPSDDPRLSRAWTLVDLPQYKFAVAETIDGQPLDVWLAKAGRLDVGEACRLVRELALALAPLHRSGQAHGAIFAPAILRHASGAEQLLTFPLIDDPLAPADAPSLAIGASHALLSNRGADLKPMLLASAWSVAPELLIGGNHPTPQGDVYALGWLLLQLLTGQSAPPAASQITESLRQRIAQPLPRFDGPAALLPQQVTKLLGYFLAREPADRYQSAAQVAEALAPYAALAKAPVEPLQPPATTSAYETWLAQAPRPAEHAPAEPGFDPELAAVTASLASPRGAARDGRPRNKRRFMPGLAALCLAAASLSIAIYVLRQRGEEPPTAAAQSRPAVPATPAPQVAEPPTSPPPTTGDNPLGQPLWEHPGDGQPIALDWLPAGAQLIVALDAAALAAHPESAKIVDAAGPLAVKLNDDIAALTGQTLAQLERVVVGCYDRSPAPAEVAWVIRGKTPWDISQIPAGQAPASDMQGELVHRDGVRAAFIPQAGDGRTLVVCSPSQLDELLAAKGAPAELRREFAILHAASDEACLLNVLFSPTFLTRGGKALVPDELRPADRIFEDFLGANATAALLTVQIDRDLFVELRVHGTAERPPLAIAQGFRSRLTALPSRVEQHLAGLTPTDYSREVLARFPQMVQTLVDYTRLGLDDRHTVLRAYLPVEAGPNLLWGSRLALRETPRGPVGAVAAQAARPIAEVLKQPYSMSFPRLPLDRALAQFGDDLGFEVIILGADLQLEGITKNQPLSLNERDSTAAAVLRKIMLQANPDGKLVWVIKPRPDGAGEALFITTRQAAAARGDTLPPELAAGK